MDWKQNKDKDEWTCDKYKITKRPTLKRGLKPDETVPVYHCYHDGLYKAQFNNLQAAQAKCQAHQKNPALQKKAGIWR